MPEEMQSGAPEIGVDGTQTEPPAAESNAESPVKDWEAEAKKWQAMSRETEKKAAANAKRLREIDERDMSELDLAKKTAQESVAELAEIRRQNTLLAKGIPADLIPPANASADDLAAYADRLLDWRNAGVQVPVGPPQPRPDRAQGAQPQDPGLSEDAEYAQYAAKYFTNNR